jgi:4-hydroxy-3-methylbut-2-en-1-yl diphosphate synthase IspG/GcpE
MYNTDRIKKWKEETQDMIDKILENQSDKLEVIIEEELRKGDYIQFGMGTGSLDNAKGQSYKYDLESNIADKAVDFLDELIALQYNDSFETGITIRDFKKQ